MKKSFYFLMFIFAFVLPSFTITPDKDSDHKTVLQTTSDSVAISVAFQNPKLTITDDRKVLVEVLNAQALTNKELLDAVKHFNINYDDFVYLQERRYGPIMDQLAERTQYSIGQINKFIKQHYAYNISLSVMLLLSTFLLITIYVTSYRRLNGTMINLVLIGLGSIIVLGLTLYSIWPVLMGPDYAKFYELLKISP